MTPEHANALAGKIVDFFNGRGGFDHWWGDIDEDVREEILMELADLLESE